MSMGAFKASMDGYISHKFGGLLSGTSAVNVAQLYSRHQSALALIHLRPPGGSKFVFHYYSLGGDTAMPGGLYARLCHSFLVLNRNCNISKYFVTPTCQMKGWFTNISIKMVAMSMSLKGSEMIKIDYLYEHILIQFGENIVKIGPY